MDASNDPLGTGASTEAPVPVDTATSVRQKRKPMKLRSSVWSDFDRFKNEQGETRARCKYCHKDYSGEGANDISKLDVRAGQTSSTTANSVMLCFCSAFTLFFCLSSLLATATVCYSF
ncbi:hypothetical protein POM88_001438 [Heracleum sosnowskyi]|uniref:BED-type domain-containing protein n=1 Tax=Heracleum sosnowskyi TaxID=360622 RepID=A0AAD8JEW3_9APIA|nr:hypothetical protein POM88_001438 [Heracleum sosnowskyi]